MSRSDGRRLDDMREMCAVVALLTGRGERAFAEDPAIQLALERALEILGEAANHISEVGRADFPSVAWRDIVRLRIRLVHHYHRIEPALVWGIATRDVPLVAEELGPLTAGGDE